MSEYEYELRIPGRENYGGQLVLVSGESSYHVADIDFNPEDALACAGVISAMIEKANESLREGTLARPEPGSPPPTGPTQGAQG